MKNILSLLCIIALLTSCAVIPKESVELSATVGRDVVNVYQAHKELSTILKFFSSVNLSSSKSKL